MRLFLSSALALTCMAACGEPAEPVSPSVSIPDPRPGVVEDRFARLALTCVHQEYPNKIAHVMTRDADAMTPRQMFPAFYGCFDWHSSVHGHWLLTRILKTDPETPMRPAIEAALAQSFTGENIAGEIAYYSGEDRASFERPYGIAWFLQLIAELHESDEPLLQEWRGTLMPLETMIVERIEAWLPRLAYPIRLGTHNQTAFAFGLMLDYARTVDNESLETQLTDTILTFHKDDVDCPLAYEPSGEDFLSPCLMEADVMRRVMTKDDFADWLSAFLPQIPDDGSADWLTPGIVLDPTDGKLVHLDGVNLSRAWALEGMAEGLPADDPRRDALVASAMQHKEVGIAAVSDEHYAGSHWLGSFATYLTTKRGL
ncbi:MAG: DUF2891 domain-containing protein [Pseudomonadota bacterium]